MSTYGEDSLNEHTEDLDAMRMRLGGKPGNNGAGPTREQLIATGELDPEDEETAGELDEEELEEGGSPGKTSPSKDVAIPDEKQTSIRKQIESALLAGTSQAELLAKGYNKKSIQTIASELKSKLGTRRPIGKAPIRNKAGLPIFAGGSPPEAIIDNVEVPDVAGGQGIPFEQGIKFGMSLVILGVRVAQELSGIGITQAKPILDMAKSMREGEALAAKNAAGEAANDAAGQVVETLGPVLANLQRNTGGVGEGGDPVKAMMVRQMEPMMGKLMQGVFAMIMPSLGAPQLNEPKDNQPPSNASNASNVTGWTRRSE